jgi:hypothetical protein
MVRKAASVIQLKVNPALYNGSDPVWAFSSIEQMWSPHVWGTNRIRKEAMRTLYNSNITVTVTPVFCWKSWSPMVVCMDAKQSDNLFKQRDKLVSNAAGADMGADTDEDKVARSTLWDGVVISITTKDSVTGSDSIIYIEHDNSIYIYFSQQ